MGEGGGYATATAQAGDVLVDIVTDREAGTYEAYLYGKGCAVKSLMFGLQASQQNYAAFLRMVENSLTEYADHYFEEYDNYYLCLIFKPLDPFERRLKII